VQFVTFWVNLNFRNTVTNAVTPITDLICALFGPYAAMFVNRFYPWKSLKTSFVSPGKPWNLVFASPGKSWKTVFYCLYEPWIPMRKFWSSGYALACQIAVILCLSRDEKYALGLSFGLF